jgi:hypothetical protein
MSYDGEKNVAATVRLSSRPKPRFGRGIAVQGCAGAGTHAPKVGANLVFALSPALDVGTRRSERREMQSEMASGPGYYKGAISFIACQGRGVPAVPLVLVGVLP